MKNIKLNKFFVWAFWLPVLLFIQNLQAGWVPQRHYTVDDGLPQSIITDMIKDNRGFIWLASNGGISRFDGRKFRNYSLTNGYPFHLVTGIIEKKPNVLWVADYANGLYQLSDHQIKKINLPSKKASYHLNFIKKEKDNTILIGIAPDGLAVNKNGSFKDYFNVKGLENEPVLSAAIDAEGAIWVGTFKKGAYKLKNGRVVLALSEADGLPGDEIRSILPLKNGEVWFGTNKGLFVLGNKKISDEFNKTYPNNFIFAIESHNGRDIWISVSKGDGGLFHFRDEKLIAVIKRKVSFYPRSIYFDKDQVMYISSNNGFYIIPDRSFTNFDNKDGFEDPYIKAVTSEPGGRLWIATKGAGIYWREHGKFKHFENPDYNYSVKTTMCLKYIKDKLWVGTRRGLFYIKKGLVLEDTLSRYIGDHEVRGIYIFNKGQPFVLIKRRILKISANSITDMTYNLKGENNSFWGLGYDKNGNLFLATNGNGLWTLQDSSWTLFAPAVVMGVKNFFGIRSDSSGNLYFPSTQGAYKWNGKKFSRVFNEHETVWDILPAGENDVWFGTNHGLFREKNHNSYLFNRKSGFVSTEYNIGSFFKENEKSFWFGGVTGLLHYQAGKKVIAIKGHLYITAIHSRDSLYTFPKTGTLIFNPEDNNLVFNFAYVNMVYSGNLKYRYFLEGFDRDTINAGQQTTATYTNLPDGTYRFHLFVRKVYDTKEIASQKIIFTILKPWWKAWWAYLLYVLAFALVFFLIVKWRLRALHQRNILLEKRIEERMSDLHMSNKMLIKEVQVRKKAEASVAQEKEQLAVTLRSITDGVVRLDIEGKIVLMNSVAERLSGVNIQEASRKNVAEACKIFDEKSKKPIRFIPDEMIKKYNLTAQPVVVYLQNQKTKSDSLISLNGSPIYDQDKNRLGYVFVFRDITHEREMENEIFKAQKLDSIGILAGGIAHDFNNILSGILGNAQLAELAHLKGKSIDKYLNGIIEATQVATNLTQQLLTFSKGGKPVKKNISLQTILPEAVEFALRGSNVTSVIKIDPKLWSMLADAGQINQVINNLIINADQAMPSGGLIKVFASNVEIGTEDNITNLPAGKYIQIKIVDQGIGISKENLKKIFDPYFTTKQKGSGLGLASTYSIIEKHNGKILVESLVGKGTTFTIYLPAVEETVKKPEKKAENLRQGHGKILVMDDEPYIREIIKDMLRMLGYEVTLAENGQQAIRLFKTALNSGQAFDLVIMDLTIPGGMGGKETVGKIHKIDPGAKVIVASGYSTDSIMADYKDYGFMAMLSKPFKVEDLSVMLDAVLGKVE